MGVFVTSTSTVNRHGVFAIERKSPAVIKPIGTGVVAIVGQFPWGPPQAIYQPEDIGDALNTFGPSGVDHLNSAYLALTSKAFPSLRIVRVLKSTAVVATANFSNAVPTAIVTINAKFAGTEGNNISIAIQAASDGDANHFNIVATLTSASGTTVDTIKNWNFSGVGADSTLTQAQLNALKLIGVPVKLAVGRPINSVASLASGTSPAVASADYVGTAGLGDKGIALLEGDKTVRHVVTDDPGNALRAAVNAGLQAHAILMGDRVVYLSGNSGQTAAAARTDALTYVSRRVVYMDPWVYQLDDVIGSKRLTPGAPFAASLAAQTSPSTSIAWKAVEQREKLAGIVDLEFMRGDSAGSNTDGGVSTFIKEDTGGFTIEAAVLTSYPADPSTGRLTRTRMGDYIAVSFANSIREFVDAPNVEVNQDNIVRALDGFMGGLKRAKGQDPNHTPHVVDYAIGSLQAANSFDSTQSGKFIIPLQVTTSVGMEQIFLSIEFGETVQITAQ